MSKHAHLQSMVEQISDKGHGCAPFHYEQKPNLASESIKLEDSSIQLRAYQIHLEKGGYALDNWLEAERSLNNTDKAVSSLINEGNPNTQK